MKFTITRLSFDNTLYSVSVDSRMGMRPNVKRNELIRWLSSLGVRSTVIEDVLGILPDSSITVDVSAGRCPGEAKAS